MNQHINLLLKNIKRYQFLSGTLNPHYFVIIKNRRYQTQNTVRWPRCHPKTGSTWNPPSQRDNVCSVFLRADHDPWLVMFTRKLVLHFKENEIEIEHKRPEKNIAAPQKFCFSTWCFCLYILSSLFPQDKITLPNYLLHV